MLSILPNLIYIPHSINYKCLWYIYYLVIIRYKEFNKMLPKAAVLLLVIISRQENTSIAESLDTDLQVVIRR